MKLQHFEKIAEEHMSSVDMKSKGAKVSPASKTEEASSVFADPENARQRAAFIRRKVLENLEEYLIDFETQFTQNGGTIIWAQDAAEACNAVESVLEKQSAKSIYFDPSAITKEIKLDEHLNQRGIKGTHNPTQADTIICSSHFLTTDTGSVVVREDPQQQTAVVETMICLSGIEMLLLSIEDLDLFIPLLETYATPSVKGKLKILSGNGRDCRNLTLVLIDNGRTRLLAKNPQRETLACIQCGACWEVCPVHRISGSKAYNYPLPGPIGAAVSPHLGGIKEFGHLSMASTLCEKCTQVCPVNIELHHHLIQNRHEYRKEVHPSIKKRFGWQLWKRAMKSRNLMNMLSGNAKNGLLRTMFKSSWGKHRNMPKVANKSFNERWQKEH